MKNPHYQRLLRMQREYHQSHQWNLSAGALYIPHSYKEKKPNDLSWWDDVGFILNRRRVIVWWQHPRMVYSDAIGEQSSAEAGAGPQTDSPFQESTKNFKQVGRSRKKVASYSSGELGQDQKQYHQLLLGIQKRLTADGIDLDVPTSWSRKPLPRAMGVSLVAPLEVRNEVELAVVASLARRLILGETTLESEFPGYRYTREDWLREQKIIRETVS
ncbi:hypothetical protein RCH09_003638 [Actimicrobium sp. GrIS 1.19]|uniref:hypothetical protein n=1 Tax=Actimicrobium sp. GrIS 1.19 TaxID=3071708 RepID=UPI002E0A57E5|nr:hypothetical protein [Actimicrobium sp. GrIS 1.19]